MFPVLLPKGIVVNSSDIYSEVASYRTVPPEKLSEYWHVYTTTFRKLIDPTAHRLENFWWHVWGSDRRFLSGAVLARLFEDISRGPTVVELLGPPGRFEGTTQRSAASQTPASQQPGQRPPPTLNAQGENKDNASNSADPPLKPLSSSSSKPPPPHPILKKSRGPSSSGPRPTARFISPHESSEENGGDVPQKGKGSGVSKDGGASSLVRTCPGQTNVPTLSQKNTVMSGDIPLATPSPPGPKMGSRKGTPIGSKKPLGTKSTSRRPPQFARRTGSQPQTGSGEEGAVTGKSGGSGTGGSKRVDSGGGPSSMVEGTRRPGETGTGSHAPVLGAKTTGKRPAIPRPASDTKSQPQGQTAVQNRLPEIPQCMPMPTRGRRDVPGAQPSSLDLTRQARPPGFDAVIARNQSARDLAPRGFEPVGAQPMVRSQSDMGSRDDESGATWRHPVKGLISGTTTVTSSVAAQGTFEFDQPLVPRPIEQDKESEDDSLDHYPQGRQPSSFLESRLTPTAPKPSPDVPLGRTKSQLTLLLERERTRLGQS